MRLNEIEVKLNGIPVREPSTTLDRRIAALLGRPETEADDLIHSEAIRGKRESSAALGGRGVETKRTPWYWRRKVQALVGLAACLIAFATIWYVIAGYGARTAFAQAVYRLQHARTFSCRQVSQSVRDGQTQVHEMAFFFKEPDRERLEHRSEVTDGVEVVITDYGNHRRLQLFPNTKTATPQDISSRYHIIEGTGEARALTLDTGVRDQLLELSARSVTDLGLVQVDNQTVRLLQSRGSEGTTQLYINPTTGLPVRVAVEWPSRHASLTYNSIKIDEDLDDRLFSTDVPDGYTLSGVDTPDPSADYNGKMMAKMKYLATQCAMFAGNHGGEFPAELSLLDIGEAALRTMLYVPGQPDGANVIHYRRPTAGSDEGRTIIIYEAPELRHDGKLAAGFMDGHAQILTQEQFKEMMR